MQYATWAVLKPEQRRYVAGFIRRTSQGQVLRLLALKLTMGEEGTEEGREPLKGLGRKWATFGFGDKQGLVREEFTFPESLWVAQGNRNIIASYLWEAEGLQTGN